MGSGGPGPSSSPPALGTPFVPPRSRSRRPYVLGVVLAVAVAAGGYVALVWWPSSVELNVPCGVLDPSVEYEGVDVGYLFVLESPPAAGEPSYADNTTCDAVMTQHVSPGAHLDEGTVLKNADRGASHTLESLRAGGGFGLVSVTPALPLTLGANETVQLQIVLSAPSTPGSYSLPSGNDLVVETE